MSELDKFKRRLIRSVARRLLLQDQNETEAWEQLSKQTGCDCKLLWDRMRSLTIKKLRRLLLACDKIENVAAVARLSKTDWLLFDLVLVHEKIDVIDKESIAKRGEGAALVDLFQLVCRHRTELLDAGQLADAWTRLTIEYNSQGRQCSPMLLQRRWYQLKEMTRSTFYNLWNSYRGNQRLWEEAKKDIRPTELQSDIAQQFPSIITQPFPDWEELVQQGKVIVDLEEFEIRARINAPKILDGKPDVVMIEPQIETIDLGLDSDDEPGNETLNDNAQPLITDSNELTIVKVKQEPVDFEEDGLSNVQILEATHIPTETLDEPSTSQEINTRHKNKKELEIECMKLQQQDEDMNSAHDEFPEDNETDNIESEVELILNSKLEAIRKPEVINTTEEPSIQKEASIMPEDLIKQKADEYVRSSLNKNHNSLVPQIEDVEVSADKNEISTHEDLIKLKADEYIRRTLVKTFPAKVSPIIKVSSEEKEESLPEDLIKQKADEYIRKTIAKPLSVKMPPIVEVSPEKIEKALIPEDLIQQKADEYIRRSKVKPHSKPKVKATKIHDLVQDVVDDIIKQKPDDFVKKEEVNKMVSKLNDDSNTASKMDFVDDGIEFVDDGIEIMEEDDDFIEATMNKKDASVGIKTETIEEKCKESSKFDLKLLMNPIVYTTKLDDMNVFKGKQFNTEFYSVKEKTIIDKVRLESIPVSKKTTNIEVQKGPDTSVELNVQKDAEKSDDLFYNGGNCTVDDENDVEEHEDHTEISESLKLKPTSNLLQKPKHRSYNPVQLCMNPDFNTRLKRLTTGFFCSSRNIQLLNACKPLTIDLNKAFESRLIDGTLYLKSCEENVTEASKEEESIQATSVVPSAMPLQSLLNNANSRADIHDLVPAPILSRHIDAVDLTELPCKSEILETTAEDDSVHRNKVINLKDLSEIRRINQKILTAEVTPMRPASADVQKPTSDIHQLQAALLEDLGQAESRTTCAPPKPVQNSHIINNDLLVEKPNQPIDFQSTNWRRRGPKPRSIPEKVIKFVRPCSFHQIPGRRVPVPWLSRPRAPPPPDDHLLTIDTLNRMINKLTGRDEFLTDHTKQKKKTQKISSQAAKKINPDKLNTKTNTSPVVPQSETPSKPTKNATKIAKCAWKKKPVKLVTNYCCWANEKLAKLHTPQRVRVHHQCGKVCQCCCREELDKEMESRVWTIKSREKTVKYLVKAKSVSNTIVLSDDENSDESEASNAIDKGTQLDVEEEIERPTPKIRVYSGLPRPPTPPKIRVRAAAASVDCSSKDTQPRGRYAPISTVVAQPSEQEPVLRVKINFTSDLTTDGKSMAIEAPPINPAAMLQNIPFDPPNITQVIPHPTIQVDSVPSPTSQLNVNQRSIVIDASTPTYTINESSSDKTVYVSRKNTEKENPIFLGKNKLLLTTVKFPPHLLNNHNEHKKDERPPAKVVSTSPLPNGVQLVLLPDGQLSFLVNPNVQLTAEEMAILPTILAAVQEQINSNVNTVTTADIQTSNTDQSYPSMIPNPADHTEGSDNDNTQQTVLSNTNNTVDISVQPSETAESPVIIPSSNTVDISVQPSENTESPVIIPSSTNDASSEKNVVEEPNNLKDNMAPSSNEMVESNKESGNSRNLLSDLMEMSGISAEDATAALQGESTVLAATSAMPQEVTADIQPPVVSAEEAHNLPGLTPITSLAQLKYACENDGKFFKLDLETGTITPIAVCIKKLAKKGPQPILPKVVIDLTEDFISPLEKEVKPVKLFKVHSSGKPNIMIKRKRNIYLRSEKAMPRTRKRLLHYNNKVEAKIDLVDSDAPMEEEYLVDSFDSDDSSKGTQKTALTKKANKDVSDDSSDDEPLAKKSSRIKAFTDNKTESIVSLGIPAKEPLEGGKALIEKETNSIDMPEATEVSVEPTQPPNEAEQDYNNAGSDMELEESPMMAFLEDEGDSQEDCILGV